MRSSKLGRHLVAFRYIWKDIIFRSIVITTLVIFALWTASDTSNNARNLSRDSVDLQGNEAEKSVATYTLWLDALTAILAISTFGLWVVTLRSFQKQGIESRRALRIAQASADASREQVRLSRSTLVDTERAYVFCESITSSWTAIKATEQITSWVFHIVWRNSGKTPTRFGQTAVNKWDAVDAGELPSKFDYPDYGTPENIIIGPNALIHSGTFDISIEQLIEMRAGIRHVYLWGWVEYNDVFGDTGRHRSECCFEILVSGNPTYKEGGFHYKRHGPFNGFDEECFRAPTPSKHTRSPNEGTGDSSRL